jgi:hypothetical protein
MTKPHRTGDRRRRARRELLEATEAAPIAAWRPRRRRALPPELPFGIPPADLRAARERRRRQTQADAGAARPYERSDQSSGLASVRLPTISPSTPSTSTSPRVCGGSSAE